MANYYLIVTTPKDYLLDVKNGFQCAGFPYRNRAAVNQMCPGDKIIYYVTKVSKFCASVEVTGDAYTSRTQIWDDPYDLWEYRIPTQPLSYVKSYMEGVYIKDIWDNLNMIKNKGKWGSQLMGSYRLLTENDYNVIMNALNGEKTK